MRQYLNLLIQIYLLIFSKVRGDCKNEAIKFYSHGFAENLEVYDDVLEMEYLETLMQCFAAVERRRRWYKWFVYNSTSEMCITSRCRHVPVHTSPVHTGSVYYAQEVLLMQSCTDVINADPTAADGEYWLFPNASTFLGCPTRAYCHSMISASPEQYISLAAQNVGNYPNEQNINCDGNVNDLAHDSSGLTEFFKIRVDTQTMTVMRDNYTFANSSGYFHPFAEANDCFAERKDNCQPRGTFHVNTSGTGVIISEQQEWVEVGHKPFTKLVERSADGNIVDLLCGGACGGCKPSRTLVLQRNPLEELLEETAKLIDY